MFSVSVFLKIGVSSWLKNFAFLKKKGVFLGPNVCGKGVCFTMENADTSSLTSVCAGTGSAFDWHRAFLQAHGCHLPIPISRLRSHYMNFRLLY